MTWLSALNAFVRLWRGLTARHNPNPQLTQENPMTLTEAIAAVETKVTDLDTADNSQKQAQAKFDAAQLAKSNADQADTDAVTAFNQSLDDLITAAGSAKRTAPAPVA